MHPLVDLVHLDPFCVKNFRQCKPSIWKFSAQSDLDFQGWLLFGCLHFFHEKYKT